LLDFTFSELAKRSDQNPAPWRRPLITWLNGVESGWAIPLMLLCFVTIWMAYLVVAYIGSDLHPDVLETWTLGRRFEWGNPKHPPLMGWVARAWTTVFPVSDWSMQLMAMVNAAMGLWAVDLISKQFVTGHKRVLVLLLLMLTPVYQFHAQRFNANTVLLTIWPLATYCFLRSVQTRTVIWAAFAGVTSALAMLGKYYSIFLVAAFCIAAIAHSSRRAYFSSAAPYVSIAAGSLALAPHVYWLVNNGAPTFDHAMAHAGFDLVTVLLDVLNFLAGLAAALSVAAITWLMIAGRRLDRVAVDFKAADPGLKLLLFVLVATIVLPILTSLTLRTDLPSLWALQGIFPLAVLVVCATSYPIEQFYTVNATVLAAGIAVVATTVAAPIHAVHRNHYGYEEGRNFYRQAALELTRQWHEVGDGPLPRVSGDDSLAFAAAFYSPDHPFYSRPFAYQYTWKVPRKTTIERGWAALCFADQFDCLDWMAAAGARSEYSVRHEFTVQANLLGIPGISRRVISLIVPPREPSRVDAPESGDAPNADVAILGNSLGPGSR
jgi:4-amino-4-deoxy-L-arabinose transferase-like glycosyltransferase